MVRISPPYAKSVAVRHSLKVLPVNLPIRPWPLSILTLKNRTMSPVVERFIECAREIAKTAGEGERVGAMSAHSAAFEGKADISQRLTNNQDL